MGGLEALNKGRKDTSMGCHWSVGWKPALQMGRVSCLLRFSGSKYWGVLKLEVNMNFGKKQNQFKPLQVIYQSLCLAGGIAMLGSLLFQDIFAIRNYPRPFPRAFFKRRTSESDMTKKIWTDWILPDTLRVLLLNNISNPKYICCHLIQHWYIFLPTWTIKIN